ncbi:hypothetical protein TI39_contig4128g00026 [Zymoseptoria brevis]|uniref:Uncharacterized protein n=1 Tax=Zymoseptoria brevis TaxID=1047168 RepID=A0A0F4GCY2_9PEZI|nr:hypothetical protein TI39_contig4128g00026 [Zymoseptoria brevis]
MSIILKLDPRLLEAEALRVLEKSSAREPDAQASLRSADENDPVIESDNNSTATSDSRASSWDPEAAATESRCEAENNPYKRRKASGSSKARKRRKRGPNLVTFDSGMQQYLLDLYSDVKKNWREHTFNAMMDRLYPNTSKSPWRQNISMMQGLVELSKHFAGQPYRAEDLLREAIESRKEAATGAVRNRLTADDVKKALSNLEEVEFEDEEESVVEDMEPDPELLDDAQEEFGSAERVNGRDQVGEGADNQFQGEPPASSGSASPLSGSHTSTTQSSTASKSTTATSASSASVELPDVEQLRRIHEIELAMKQDRERVRACIREETQHLRDAAKRDKEAAEFELMARDLVQSARECKELAEEGKRYALECRQQAVEGDRAIRAKIEQLDRALADYRAGVVTGI